MKPPKDERYFAGSEIVATNIMERMIKRNVMVNNFCQGFIFPVVFFTFSMDKFLLRYLSQSLFRFPKESGTLISLV